MQVLFMLLFFVGETITAELFGPRDQGREILACDRFPGVICRAKWIDSAMVS